MKNKILIRLFVPELDYNFDVFIPANEIVWKVKRLLSKSVSDLTNGGIDASGDYVLLNKVTSKVYDNNDVILETDIRNATELILLSVKKNRIEFEKSIPIPSQEEKKDVKNNLLEGIFNKFKGE